MQRVNDSLTAPAGDPLEWVLGELEQNHLLLVIDQFEALFEPGQMAGSFRPKTTRIEQFFSSGLRTTPSKPGDLGESRKTPELQPDARAPNPGISTRGTALRCGTAAFTGARVTVYCPRWQTLFDRYGGNPLLLKGIGATVQEVYQGKVPAFFIGCRPGHSQLISRWH